MKTLDELIALPPPPRRVAKADALAYLADMADELSEIALSYGEPLLAYMFRLARDQAVPGTESPHLVEGSLVDH